VQVHFINHANDGGIDGRIGTPDGSHRRKTFGGEQDAFADSRVHGIQRKHRVAAVGAVQIERLDDENLAASCEGDFCVATTSPMIRPISMREV